VLQYVEANDKIKAAIAKREDLKVGLDLSG
jgi:hypothetical protein